MPYIPLPLYITPIFYPCQEESVRIYFIYCEGFRLTISQKPPDLFKLATKSSHRHALLLNSPLFANV